MDILEKSNVSYRTSDLSTGSLSYASGCCSSTTCSTCTCTCGVVALES